jgi:transposase InsO family protein
VKLDGMKAEAGSEEEVKHLEMVMRLFKENGERAAGAGERGSTWQRGRRDLERQVREEAVEYRNSMVIEGRTRREAAKDLGLSPRTLGQWATQPTPGSLEAKVRGRPLKDSGPFLRNKMIAFVQMVGLGTGVRRIRGVFPLMPRCEVIEILARLRRAHLRNHALLIHELEWTMPGAVWAMDHAEPPEAIDGHYPALLSVRDLSSGQQLLWKPLDSMNAAEAMAELIVLFQKAGAPLVMKSDNGSAFISEEMEELLNSHGVIHLLSPPGFPQYNGSCESGIGALKDRTMWKAALGGRPREWTSGDLEAARHEANEIPPGPGSPSAGEKWRGREAITCELRAAFGKGVIEAVAEDRGWLEVQGLAATPEREAQIRRTAIRRALVAHGLLKTRRRWIPLPKNLLRRAKIS